METSAAPAVPVPTLYDSTAELRARIRAELEMLSSEPAPSREEALPVLAAVAEIIGRG